VYFIIKGRVGVYHKDPKIVVDVLHDKEYFGDMCLPSLKSHFDYVSLGETICLFIETKALVEVMISHRASYKSALETARFRIKYMLYMKDIDGHGLNRKSALEGVKSKELSPRDGSDPMYDPIPREGNTKLFTEDNEEEDNKKKSHKKQILGSLHKPSHTSVQADAQTNLFILPHPKKPLQSALSRLSGSNIKQESDANKLPDDNDKQLEAGQPLMTIPDDEPEDKLSATQLMKVKKIFGKEKSKKQSSDYLALLSNISNNVALDASVDSVEDPVQNPIDVISCHHSDARKPNVGTRGA
jgi:hypothetical protein